MAFTELGLKRHYTTYKNNIVKEFYTPVLKETILYQRSVGFFSSTALIGLTKGLHGLVKNNGKIQFIVSPYLDKDDVEAINKGYEKRDVIEKALLRELKEPVDYFEEERLNLLAHLIENGTLEIKVAFTPPDKITGMYHEKVGILTDANGNKIVFTGSMNETINAFYNNFESIVVFKTWEESKNYAEDMQEDFESLWNNKTKDIEVIEFPNVLKEQIKVHKKKVLHEDIDIEEYETEQEDSLDIGIPYMPKGFELRKYQIDAIEQWKNNGYRGIFDMATGTGKTYTGLGAIVKLFEDKKRLAIIIVCPYQHLVEQWVEDIELFNMTPTIGYSSSRQKNWKKRLEDDVLDFSIRVIDSFCFVTTNATYSSKFVSDIMANLGQDTLLLVDEAHNFGSPRLQKKLYPTIQYRLALSATLERHGDKEGTKCLTDYFGEKCIEYDLQRAIKEGKLTPYYYYPICIYFDDDELAEYKDISYKASKEIYRDKHGKITITEKGKTLLMQRARKVAGARGKLTELRKLIKDYKTDSHMLIYCGATKVQNFDQDSSENDEEGERQIVLVSQMLGHEFGMKVTHFTSNESAEEREIIKRRFSTVDPYQAIVAIKCLDEGVNIPSIKTAFILASTTNPKEYIQRRGRVLRLAKDKPYAVIYDFVTLSRPLDEVDPYSPDYNCERVLAKRELVRIKEFGEIALNSRDSDELINDIECTYKISNHELEDDEDGSELG
ncbi:superfamily II DNA or RNA helicase [Ruminiclostridium sufflavum DSM 19573]|uniref:Superfamily II DNA or RNA helicase n=1 Tax=Ruminiclostridium sufflavum DSM 19573 TaxID=1121337 RepID=A0A318XKT6_9FIRM|nr:DEAD/DEAH box helicase family protein [Ruminiclostridium sufflavum]PYG86602.1 superfamily II DNA or RNA helicase [Ruminiclostridium sufflavum DSM 19573]